MSSQYDNLTSNDLLTFRPFQRFTVIGISILLSLEMTIYHILNGAIQMVTGLSPFLSPLDAVQNLVFGSRQGSAGLTGHLTQQVRGPQTARSKLPYLNLPRSGERESVTVYPRVGPCIPEKVSHWNSLAL